MPLLHHFALICSILKVWCPGVKHHAPAVRFVGDARVSTALPPPSSDAAQFDAAQFDVAVVGYGPVGMVMAALLARAGHRVVVFERYGGLYNLPRAASFDDETMRTLAKLGLADSLLPTLRVQPNYEWRNGAGQLLIEQTYANPGRSGWAEWYMMYQPDLEDALDALNRASPLVDVRLNSDVVAVDDCGSRVALAVRGAAETDPVTARFVVACDGGNSTVRDRLGVDQDDYGFAEPWMVCDFRFRRPVELPNALQLGDPAAPTSIISIGPRHHRFSFMLDSPGDFERERAPELVWARVSRYLRPDDAELIRVATYTFRSLVSRQWRVGRVLLAGDAAHQMPPFLGQGMVSGIRDAQNIAFKLDWVLRDLAPVEVLDTYQREREPHVRTVIERGVELGRMQTVRDPAKAAERDRTLLARREQPEPVPDPSDGGVRAMRFPALVDGLLATASGPGRGDISVQGVVDDGAVRDRLDQVVECGFQLLLDEELLDAADLSEHLAAARAAGVRVIAFGTPARLHPHAVVVDDVDGTHRRWFDQLGCSAVLVRPDFYVYGTAGSDPVAVAALVDDLLGVLTAVSP